MRTFYSMERWELPNGRVKYYQGGNGRYINFVARTANYKLQRAYKKKPRKDLSDHNRLQNKVVPGHAYIKCCIVDCVVCCWLLGVGLLSF